jgi:tRNA(adenine34) deaminase
VVFAAPDPKTGAAGSVVDLFGDRALNHQTEVVGGVQAEAAGALLREFFAQRRAVLRAERSAATAVSDGDAEPSADDTAPIPTGEVIESQPPSDEPR